VFYEESKDVESTNHLVFDQILDVAEDKNQAIEASKDPIDKGFAKFNN
jgi:hypothetical protein